MLRDARDQVAGSRPPDPEGRDGGGGVDQLHRPVGRQVGAEPEQVPCALGSAGDHPEVVGTAPHDGQIRAERSGGGQQRGVDHAADAHVDTGHGQLLEVAQGSWPTHVEDRECAEIDQGDALAHGQVLGLDDRRPPAAIPFGRAFGDAVAVLLEQSGIGLVPLRALPAGGLEVLRPEGFGAGMERTGAQRAVGEPLLARMADPVDLRESLGRTRPHMGGAALGRMEARDVRAVGIDLAGPVRDQLGQHPAHSRSFLDPHCSCGPQPGDLRRLAHQCSAVRSHGEQSVQRGPAGRGRIGQELGEHLLRLLHLEREVVLREGEAGRGGLSGVVSDRRDLLRAVQQGTVRIGADLEVGPPLALVHQAVHVAQQREADPLAGLLELRDRAHVDHLVHRGRQRDRSACEGGHPGAPHAAGDHHDLRLDRPVIGDHAGDTATFDLDVEHLGLRARGERTEPFRALAHQLSRPDRIDDRPRGRVEASDQQTRVAVRDELLDLGGGDQMGLDAPGAGGAHASRELLHPFRAACDLDAAAGEEHVECGVLAQRVHREVGDLLRMIDREHEVRGVTGRAPGIRQGTFVDLHDAAPSELGQVADGGIAYHPRSDDDDVCAVRLLCHGVLPN